MHTISQFIWFALILVIITGLGLYLPEAARFNQSAKFLVKVIVVSVITINGLFLNLLVAPNLVKVFSLENNQEIKKTSYGRMRKIAFALGAISITSWYSAFILGTLSKSPLDFLPLLFIYLCIISTAVTISQFAEKLFSQQQYKNK